MDDLLAMAKELYGFRIADMAEERSRLLARIAELERENRALWYASGKLRQACGVGNATIAECSSGEMIPGSERVTDMDDSVTAADKILGGIVPLATA